MAELASADFGFEPNLARTLNLDRQIRHRIAGSLEATLSACAGHLMWAKPDAARLLASIRGKAVSGAVMALYSDLVEALFRDDLKEAQTLLDELLSTDQRQVPKHRVCTFDDPGFGAGHAARYQRLISDDPEMPLSSRPVTHGTLEAVMPVFDDTFGLLRLAAPELYGELDVLLREIVLVNAHAPNGPLAELAGASTFYLWGATFINLTVPPNRLALAEALTHEAAHLLLFGFTSGKPLVTNGGEQRFTSPLRDDPRPMDGIVHAAYVLARLTWCMRELSNSGALTAQEAAEASMWQIRNQRYFAMCMGTIQAHARFTPTGEAIFARAASWMDQPAPAARRRLQVSRQST